MPTLNARIEQLIDAGVVREFVESLILLGNQWEQTGERKVLLNPHDPNEVLKKDIYRICNIELRTYIELFLANIKQEQLDNG